MVKTMKQHLFYTNILASAIAATYSMNSNAMLVDESSLQLEEVITTARQRDAAEQLVVERMEESHSVDVLSSVQISRAGDSDLASALRRVPGLTLVGGKYIYVRGLGERYSSTQLNGAQVPSPDFTRNVLPLDIIPTDIISSLKVQKAYDAALPAAFGGGNINIITKSIPDSFLLNLEVGTGFNSESRDGLTNGMGGDAFGDASSDLMLPSELSAAYDRYQGNLNAESIYQANVGNMSFAGAQQMNRELATALNTNFAIASESLDPDQSIKGSIGDNFYFGDDLEVGVLALGSYGNKWRTKETDRKNSTQPDLVYSSELATTNEINLTTAFTAGLRYLEDHEISLSSMFIRNTEDETASRISNNQNIIASEGNQLRDFAIRYEQREMTVHQLLGKHSLFDISGFDTIGLEWYYSDATAKTQVPSEVNISARDELDSAGNVAATFLRASSSAVSYGWTDLDDQVESYGWDLSLSRYLGNMEVLVTGGYDYWNKTRDYQEIQADISTASTSSSLLQGDSIYTTPGDVIHSDNILDPSYNLSLISGTQPSSSYVAALQDQAAYASVDVRFSESWRLNLGVRWEEFQQIVLAYNPLNYGPVSTSADEVLAATKIEDDFFPSVAMTYSNFDFMGAETFQIRAAYSNTVVRPDLREVATSSFQDPMTDFLVFGNPNLESSSLDNFDLRFEWFYDDGDNFTTSLFYKDITNPIEAYETSSVDGNVAVSYLNAESASVYGLEIEALKDLAFLVDGAFLQINTTLAQSEINIVSTDIGLTNNSRAMNGQSDWVVNAMLGYDSDGGDLSANVVYNVSGPRIAFAGVNGSSDAQERSFHSLDLNVDYYLSDALSVRFKAQNVLGEKNVYEQDDVEIVSENVGRGFSMSIKYQY